ncbi:MAG: hypothetical protein EXR58_02030 [Chloroflexi bacterium]|nr:hypothetical protein [Chloroflexota bacterium]
MVAQTARLVRLLRTLSRPFRRPPVGVTSLLVLLGAALIFHSPSLVFGLVPDEDDLRVFFFPLMALTGEALHQGRLPLWTPLIFSGYPLFADGEAGMLYPFNLLVLPLTTPEQALVILQILHSFLSSLFMFWLVRALGGRAFGGIVAGLVYAYSGFAVGQMVHGDVVRSMAWLPLELLFAERMARTAGFARLANAILCGAVFGIQGLALHVHFTILSALTVSAFILYRGVAPAWARKSGRLRDALSLALALGTVGVIGVGLAAVQLLPLLELAGETFRGAGLSVSDSTPNSIWPGNLATLVLPHLFDVGTRDYWGLWVKWETTLYVGIAPLALATLGAVAGRGPHRLFFLLLAGLSLIAAMGAYAPFPLWDTLHRLPGFNVLKSPGRFSLLFALATAVLAGRGADWLAERPSSFRWAAAIAIGAGVAVLGSGLGLQAVSDRLQAWSVSGSAFIEQYLRLPGSPVAVDGAPLSVERVARLAADSFSPSGPFTAWQLALALGTGIALACWFMGQSMRLVAPALTVALVFGDLWVNGLNSHPYLALDQLRPQVPDLLQRAGRSGDFRVLTLPSNQDKLTQVDPNRLMALRVEEANGYSSLPPDRPASYLSTVLQTDNDLLSLWNVRYVISESRPPQLPSYQGVSFHPTRPLLRSKESERGRSFGFLPDAGPVRADEFRLVADLQAGAAISDGVTVGTIRLEAPDGQTRVLQIRAGLDVSDARIDVPGGGPFAHRAAEVAFDHQRSNPDGDRYAQEIFFGRFALDPPMLIQRATIEPSLPTGRIAAYGLASFDSSTRQVTQISNPEAHPIVYTDAQIKITENREVRPRVSLVPDVVILPRGADPLLRMHDGPFDFRTTAMATAPIPEGLDLSSLTDSAVAGLGTAEITQYADQRVAIRTTTSRSALVVLADADFPGWVARVDGIPSPILRTDYLFRGVLVPAGEHEVVFSYEPRSIPIGLLITLATAATVTLLLGFAVVRRGSGAGS